MNTYKIIDIKWILIADVHLNNETINDPLLDILIQDLNDIRFLKYSILLVGDFLSAYYTIEKAWLFYPNLMEAIYQHPNVVYLRGNNDPYISNYDKAVITIGKETWYIEHGHKLPSLICAIINLFKPRKTWRNIKRNKPISKRKLELICKHYGSNTIIGHYHQGFFDTKNKFVILPPRQAVIFENIIKRNKFYVR